MKKIFGIFKSYKTSFIISGIYGLCVAAATVIFYPLIPLILNYPKGTYNNQFQWELEKANYTQQFLLSSLLIFLLVSIWITIKLLKFRNWDKIDSDSNEQHNRRLREIRKECINLPNLFFMAQSITPCLVLILSIPLTTRQISTVTLKLAIIFFAFGTFVSTVNYILTKKIFTKILLNTYSENNKNEGSRVSIKWKIFIQLVPIFIVALLFTSLIGYSRITNERGSLIYKIYKERLEDAFNNSGNISSEDEVKRALSLIITENKNDTRFYSNQNSGFYNENSEEIHLSSFFIKYMKEFAIKGDGHVFDYYGADSEGVVSEITVDGQKWIIGIRYNVGEIKTLIFFIVSFVILFILNCIVIIYIARDLSDDISRVAQNLSEISESAEVDLDSKLPITSNDEIGDLVIAFNKIQKLEKDSINAIKENQEIILEQERLASLGQLIGGIAHNLKTPIMSLAGGIEALKDLSLEYRDSIGDNSVTDQDHMEIVSEMINWLDKMKPYCAYMSDVISAVKGQAVQMSASTSDKFTVDELIKRVNLLMKHELNKYHCVMNIDARLDVYTELKGEVNNLVQVFDNIIINAIHSYEGNSGNIDLRILRVGDNVEFLFRDYGKGIPKAVADKLFKEMVTTKGKKGTGLGMYMSYSTIKGRFGGNMSFTSHEGEGTSFYITIPCITYAAREVVE